jgi:predicted amidophosphoribosyltransferase
MSNIDILMTSLYLYDKNLFCKNIIKPLFDELKINVQKKMHTCKYCKQVFTYKLKYCESCIEKIEYNYHFGGRI